MMKRILFVDDDPALLDALRVRLRGLRSKWEMVFVESGSRAIAEIEQRGFDVIVSDMRMPSMDGMQLLCAVADRWPETARIILSGYAEDQKVVGLVTIAHQYVDKPCDTKVLESTIDRCLQFGELVRAPGLRAIVGRIRKLPAVPHIYAKLQETMSRDDSTVEEVARLIGEDPAVAGKVLQVVNSSFFRTARRITRIDRAVNHLGFAAIRNLVMSAEVFSRWPSCIREPQLAPERLQAQAQKIAAMARALSHGMPWSDDAMLAGLLHGIGYLVLMQECPLELEQAVATAREQAIPLIVAERRVIGASHAEVGAYLLGLWGLPHAVVEAVALQETSDPVAHSQWDVLGALLVAHSLAAEIAKTTDESDEEAVAKHDLYLTALHVPFDWREAQRRVSSLGEGAEA